MFSPLKTMWNLIALSLLSSRSSSPPPPTVPPKPTPITTCSICSERVGVPRQDGIIELPYTLPCSHTYGSHCILRWLQDSPQHDCPHCRRRMVHPGCGHLIMPHNLATAPPSIPACETPEKCVRCRGDSVIGKALELEGERLRLQEEALRGMRTHLPGIFGSAAHGTVSTVDRRVAELRKGFGVFNEKAWRRFEEVERRERW